MHSEATIVLAGVPRAVRVTEREPIIRPDRPPQRAMSIDFEVPQCDHAALGRQLHRAMEESSILDAQGTAWTAVTMSSMLLDDTQDTRRFVVELVQA
jgi:hypothetical protein